MSKCFRYPLLLALLMFIITQGIGCLFVKNHQTQLISEQKYDAFNRLSTLRANLEGLVTSHLVVLRGLKAEVAISPSLTQERFSDIARELISDDLHIRNIALAPDLVVTNVYPHQGNSKVLGLDYRKLPQQLAAIEKAVELNAIIVAGPVNLVQGGKGLIARLPVNIGDQRTVFWGVIGAVIKYDELMAEAGVHDPFWRNGLWIRGKDASGSSGALFHGTPNDDEIAESVSSQVQLPHGSWQIGYIPEGGWQLNDYQLLPLQVFTSLLSILAAIACYLLVVAYRDRGDAVETATFRANFDGLTGLMNRHRFTRELETIIRASEVKHERFSLLFIDIDNFKPVNDTYGHHVGDLLLQEFSQRIVESIRDYDTAARLAGDEFVVLIDQSGGNSTELELLAERLLRRLSDHYSLEGHRLSVSASIGVSSYPSDGTAPTELLKNADRAMYSAKKAGRNQVYFFNHQMQAEIERHIRLHEEILLGITNKEFQVYYQPILELSSYLIHKCEALVRWNHPVRGLISPAEFIPVAEQIGSIRELGDFVLRTVCQDIQQFRNHGMSIAVAVNRSVNEFHIADPDKRWLQILNEEGVDGQSIVFEITESLLMENNSKQLALIENLRDKGAQFAIDDFGTGYSALNYLRNYPVEYLKIDRSFIQDILVDDQDRTLVDVIIRMGKTLGIQVIAEGVESVEQLQLLKELKCEYMQGFLLSKPLVKEEFISNWTSGEWLKTLSPLDQSSDQHRRIAN